jgi:hypothetical protein
MRSSPRKPAAGKSAAPVKEVKVAPENETVLRLRVLAHDLSNSLEAILQASYLLGHAKLDGDGRRWAQLIDTASQEATRINREMRKLLRSLCGD